MQSLKKIKVVGLTCFVGVILLAFDYVSSSRFFHAQEYSSSGGLSLASTSETIPIMNDSGTRLQSLFEGSFIPTVIGKRVSSGAMGDCGRQSATLVLSTSRVV